MTLHEAQREIERLVSLNRALLSANQEKDDVIDALVHDRVEQRLMRTPVGVATRVESRAS